jgi:hypothetical protein
VKVPTAAYFREHLPMAKFAECPSLLKKSALSWLRPLIGLETPQKRRIVVPDLG